MPCFSTQYKLVDSLINPLLQFGAFLPDRMRKTRDTTPSAELRILLVDDNRDGLLARKVVLEQEGYIVKTCSAPEEALAQFCECAFDIVVTDYRMPKMNGVELIAHLRKVRCDVPIVLVSSMVDVLGLNECNTGADAVIAKNATEVSHMLRAVNRLIRRPAVRKPASSQSIRRSTKASNS